MLTEEEEKYLEDIFSTVREDRTTEIWETIEAGNLRTLQEVLYESVELYRDVI